MVLLVKQVHLQKEVGANWATVSGLTCKIVCRWESISRRVGVTDTSWILGRSSYDLLDANVTDTQEKNPSSKSSRPKPPLGRSMVNCDKRWSCCRLSIEVWLINYRYHPDLDIM